MAKYSKILGRAAAILACFAIAGLTLTADAQESLVLTPSPELAMPADSAPMTMESVPMASDAAPAAEDCCCPAPCITYRTHRSARRMLRCQAQVAMTMVADNPADCVACPVEVPLCIPCCCTDAPTVTSRCGLLGRGIVEYCWSCGFTATVVFRASGDVVVHYRG